MMSIENPLLIVNNLKRREYRSGTDFDEKPKVALAFSCGMDSAVGNSLHTPELHGEGTLPMNSVQYGKRTLKGPTEFV